MMRNGRLKKSARIISAATDSVVEKFQPEINSKPSPVVSLPGVNRMPSKLSNASPTTIDAPYRRIARLAGISLGKRGRTIGKMKALNSRIAAGASGDK
jgi:hypothetical protein